MNQKRKKLDPSDPDFLRQAMSSDREIEQVMQEYKELALANQIAEPIDPKEVARATEVVEESFRNAGVIPDPELRRAEVELQLTPQREKKLREALQKIRRGKAYKQDSCQLIKLTPFSTITNPQELMASRAQLRKHVIEQQERLEKIVEQRDVVRDQDPSTIYLYPEAVNALDSTIMSYDYAGFNIARSGYGSTGHLTPMPTENQTEWISELLNGKILNDDQIETERRTIRQLLEKLNAPITL